MARRSVKCQELTPATLFIGAPEHMRAIFREPESRGMSLFVVFIAHLAQIPLLVLFWSYWRAVTGGSAAGGKIRLCLLVPAILATAYILFRLRIFGMYGVWIPGLSYLISLVLLTSPRRSPELKP